MTRLNDEKKDDGGIYPIKARCVVVVDEGV